MLYPLISMPSLGIIIVNSWLCLSVCLSQTSSWFFLFCFSLESSHFWPSVFHDSLYNMLFFDFWFRPSNPQNLIPKIFMARVWWKLGNLCTERLAWHHRDVITYHRSWISMARHTCHNSIHGMQGMAILPNEIWARRGVQSPTGLFCVKVSVNHLSFTSHRS